MQTAQPTSRQLVYQDWEFGVFVHYHLGVYARGEGFRTERDKASPELFQPTGLDCNQWADTAAKAGASYMVLTAKHHEGFCLWPSEITKDFSVSASSWRDGKGDVVRDYVDACRRHGLKVGIYYSPFDNHADCYEKDPSAYDDYFIGHLRELLGGTYGTIDIIWFDGAFSENHTFDWDRIIGEIRAMQPEILIFGEGKPDIRWVGNESGIAPLPCWNTVSEMRKSIESDQVRAIEKPQWIPAECDARIRYQWWSWHGTDDPLKSLDELMGLYYYSVGRGCNLLLNVGPDQRGVVHEDDAQRLIEFGTEITKRFSNPIAKTDDFSMEKTGATWIPQQPCLVNHVIIQEDLTNGEHIRKFVIRAQPAPGEADPITVYEGYNVGHKAICRFPTLKLQKLSAEITESDGSASLRTIECHYV